jgi:hypothetical protein
MSVVRASLKGLQASSPIPDVPDAPVIGAATNVGTSRAFNNGSATVTYTAAATGGTPVSYTITSNPGSFTGTGSSPVTVTGLQSNTAYTFTATATNTTATSAVSAATSSITATTVPATISAPTATNSGSSRAFNNGLASISFTEPSTGGSAITGYTVTSSPGSFTGTGASSPITVAGLQSSTQYTYTITATNANGNSTASSASTGVTATTVPAAPTVGSPTGGNASISVPFTAGATGGSAITGYTVTSSPGSFTGTGASSPIIVSGLSNGTSYTFTVTATNANGTSTASSASASVSPVVPVVGTTWTLGTFPVSVTQTYKVKGVGPYIVLYIENSSTFYITTNGSTWTSKTLPANMAWIEHYNGIYLALNNNGWSSNNMTYYTSTDLTNWTARTHNNGGDGGTLRKVWTEGSSIMMSATISTSTNLAIYRTTDGINWTRFETRAVNNGSTGGNDNRVAPYGSPGYLNGYYYYLTQNGGYPTGTMYSTSLSGPWTWIAFNAPNYNYGEYLTKSDYSVALTQGNGGSNGQYRVWTVPNSYTYTNPGTGGWGTNVYTTFGYGQPNPTNAFIIALREMAGGGGAYYRSVSGLTNSWTVYTNSYFNGSTYYNGGNYAAGSMQATDYLFGANSYATSTASGVMVASPVSSGTKSLYSVA